VAANNDTSGVFVSQFRRQIFFFGEKKHLSGRVRRRMVGGKGIGGVYPNLEGWKYGTAVWSADMLLTRLILRMCAFISVQCLPSLISIYVPTQ
jgi:hypothetical protein